MGKSIVGLVAALAVAGLALAGCTGTNQLVTGSRVAVAVAEPFTSLNPATSYGRASGTNADVAWLTGTGFGYPDTGDHIVDDPSFGTATVVARDPLTVRYTIAGGASWSDGAKVDAADLLLAWVANSGALNTPKFDDSAYVDPATGRYTRDFPKDAVHFDGAIGAGLERATRMPQLSADGRSLTVHFDSFLPDWKTALTAGLPAHVVAREALGLATSVSDTKADAALVAAVTGKDRTKLGALARFWNDAYNVSGTPKDAALMVASGPYRVSRIADGAVTLSANPRYHGDRQPSLQHIVLRVAADPDDAVKLLQTGQVDVASPAPSKAVLDGLLKVPGVSVGTGTDDVFEHVELQVARSKDGTFADERVRRAFLDVLPREQILELVSSLEQGAGMLDSFTLRPGSDGYDAAIAHNGSRQYRHTDVAAAVKLLAAAGVTDPEVCILFDPGDPRRVSEFQLIQTSAARAGFRVTDCSKPGWAGFLGVPGSYDAALYAWDTTRLGPTAIASLFRSDAQPANTTGYANPDVDTLVDQLGSTDDPATQTKLLTQLDGHLWADAYGAPLYAQPTVTAVDGRVSGVTRSPLARGVFWNAWTWKPLAATPEPTRKR